MDIFDPLSHLKKHIRERERTLKSKKYELNKVKGKPSLELKNETDLEEMSLEAKGKSALKLDHAIEFDSE